VEPGESWLDAGVREACEETGLDRCQVERAELLPAVTNDMEPDELVIEERAEVYARPRASSMNWGFIPRGITVRLVREEDGFVQVQYDDWHDEVCKDYLSYSLLGWIAGSRVSREKVRHYCLLDVTDDRTEWIVENDHHLFHPRWYPLQALPQDVYPGNKRIRLLQEYLEL